MIERKLLGLHAGEGPAEGEEAGAAGGPGPAGRVHGRGGGVADPGGAAVHAGVPDGAAQDVGGGADAGGRRAGGAVGGVAEGGGGPAGGGARPAPQRLDRRLHLQPQRRRAVRPEVEDRPRGSIDRSGSSPIVAG